MPTIKTLITELRPNALWEFIKFLFYLFGSAIMSTGAFALLLVLFAGAWLNWVIIIGLFVLSTLFLGIAYLLGQINRDTTISSPEKNKELETTFNFDTDSPITRVHHRNFANQEIILDGYDYSYCTFTNVKFV
jgi:hypothetical protein